MVFNVKYLAHVIFFSLFCKYLQHCQYSLWFPWLQKRKKIYKIDGTHVKWRLETWEYGFPRKQTRCIKKSNLLRFIKKIFETKRGCEELRFFFYLVSNHYMWVINPCLEHWVPRASNYPLLTRFRFNWSEEIFV